MAQSGRITYTPPALDSVYIHHDTGQYDVVIVPSLPVFSNMKVKWDDTSLIPSDIVDLTLGQILTNPLTSSSQVSTTISVTGQQGSLTNGPYTDVVMTAGSVVVTQRFTTIPPASLNPPGRYDSVYNINDSTPSFGVMTSMVVTNHSNDVGYSYDASNFTIVIAISIKLVISCSGAQLATPACLNICRGGSSSCLQQYSSYCFPSRIGSDVVCQNYFKDYIESNGPNASVDSNLSTYCTKYDGFKSLFGSGNQTDIDLCACHMPKQQYTNYTNELFAAHPELSTIPGIINLCLVPDCLNSPYPAQPIPKGGCNTPNCVVIGEFNNDGTFTGSTINESVSGCGGSPSGSIEWDIIVFVILLIVIIVVVIIVVYLWEPSDDSRVGYDYDKSDVSRSNG